MKSLALGEIERLANSRSREGAWIEIYNFYKPKLSKSVAPVRERGLKLLKLVKVIKLVRRSREGAWIEIDLTIDLDRIMTVAPVRERGLKFKDGDEWRSGGDTSLP